MNPRGQENEGARDEIARIASEWLARRRDPTRALVDEHAFKAWCDADPRHRKAYEAMCATLADLASLPELAALEPGPAQQRRRPAWIAGGLMAAAALAVFAVLIGPKLSAPAALQPHATQMAELDTLRLEDGSVVTLGASSAIDVRFSAGERRVVLLRGQAFFDVVHNESRPFVVEAGGVVIRDVGTKFDVNRGAGRVRVAVTEGMVQVTEPPRGLLLQRPDPVILRAGVRVEALERTDMLSGERAPTLSRATTSDAWRQGRFVYDDVRLGDLVADVNRYYQPGVRIADPKIAEMRVAASFRADEIEAFLATLPEAAHVRVLRDAHGAVTLSAS